MPHVLMMQILALTVDTSALTDSVQLILDNVFQWLPIVIGVLAPIAAIGIAWKFGGGIVALFSRMLSSFGGSK